MRRWKGVIKHVVEGASKTEEYKIDYAALKFVKIAVIMAAQTLRAGQSPMPILFNIFS